MTILEALIKLRDDLKLWCINNFNNKLNKNLGAEDYGRFLFVDENGDIDTSDIEISNITNLQAELNKKDAAIETAKTEASNQDAVVLLEAQESAKTYTDTVANRKADIVHSHTVSQVSDLTATATELNYMDGVTSNVQEQINGKVQANRVSQINWDNNGYPQIYVDNSTWVNLATKSSVDSVTATANAAYTRANSSVPYEVYLSNGTDLNTVVASGFYRLNIEHANNTNSSGYYACDWSQMIVCHGGGDTIMQIIVDYSTATMFVRSGNPSDIGGAGSWTAWKRMLKADDFTVSNGVLTLNFL